MARRSPLYAEAHAPERARTAAVLSAAAGRRVRVVARPISGDYRAADYLGGALLALFVLLASAVRGSPADPRQTPLVAAAAFGFGALVTSRVQGLRRPLAGPARRRAHAIAAAHVAHQGSLTVYLSVFEREAVLVGASDPAITAQLERVREAMRVGTPALVLAAVESLAPYLGDGAQPATDDDGPEPMIDDDVRGPANDDHDDDDRDAGPPAADAPAPLTPDTAP